MARSTDFLFSNNVMRNMEAASSSSLNNMAGAVGTTVINKTSKSSPESNSSSINCGWCDINATIRCLDCNEFMCKGCSQEHRQSPFSSGHSIVNLPQPIGSSPIGHTTINNNQSLQKYQCDMHNEILRYVCEFCKKLVCQCCTLREHKDHNYISIQNFVENATEKIDAALESSSIGTKCIKGSIDKALTFIRQVERNCTELSENIRKAFRQFIMAIEDRERFLLDFVDKLRSRKLAVLHDQMAGLKSALSGLAETSEMLHKVADNATRMDKIDVALKITNGQRQLEQFAAIYKDLQPKHETFVFVPPDYGILHDLRSQGGVVVAVDDKTLHSDASISGVIANVPGVLTVPGRRPILRDSSLQLPAPIARPYSALDWELSVLRTSPATSFNFGAPRLTQCIPGSLEHVKVRKSTALSTSFGLEGHEDGQVSRPWGVCVDKNGNILVSDRRNNRVQVFHPDGTLKFKFGRKGVGNGEFDLPAGICVDIDNRIIVVDKDNHRVQVDIITYILFFSNY